MHSTFGDLLGLVSGSETPGTAGRGSQTNGHLHQHWLDDHVLLCFGLRTTHNLQPSFEVQGSQAASWRLLLDRGAMFNVGVCVGC